MLIFAVVLMTGGKSDICATLVPLLDVLRLVWVLSWKSSSKLSLQYARGQVGVVQRCQLVCFFT